MANQQERRQESTQGGAPSESERAASMQPSTEQRPAGEAAARQDRPAGISRRAEPLATPFDAFRIGLSPFAFMRRMIDDMDRMMETFGFGGTPLQRKDPREAPLSRWSPQIEVLQQGDEVVVRAEMPGLKQEDVRVEILANALVIEGERRMEHESGHGDVYRTERMYGSFRRTIPLPEGTDVDSASARLDDGVLEIRLKLPGENRRGRRLEVKGQAGETQGEEKRVH